MSKCIECLSILDPLFQSAILWNPSKPDTVVSNDFVPCPRGFKINMLVLSQMM